MTAELKLLPSPSPPSSSCSSSGMKVCETCSSFSSGTWSGSRESEPPRSSPWLLWRFPPYLKYSRSAGIPRCSDPRPSPLSGPSRSGWHLSTNQTQREWGGRWRRPELQLRWQGCNNELNYPFNLRRILSLHTNWKSRGLTNYLVWLVSLGGRGRGRWWSHQTWSSHQHQWHHPPL